MDVLTCCDSNFIIPVGIMLYSLSVNNQTEKLYFHVIVDNTVTNVQKEKLSQFLSRFGTISFYRIDLAQIEKYLVVKIENFPKSVYYRLLLANILPKTVHKILYLDADIIVRKDLGKLWNTDIENVAVAAVTNQSDGCEYWKRLEYPKTLGYFNSGVLLFNLTYMRNHQITEKLIDYIKNNPEKLLMPDQDALNYVLRYEKKILDMTFNVQEGFYRKSFVFSSEREDILEILKDPTIVHYTKEKPWSKKCLHPLKNLYYVYKEQTIWAKTSFMEKFEYPQLPKPLFLQFKIFVLKKYTKLFSVQKDRKGEYVSVFLQK